MKEWEVMEAVLGMLIIGGLVISRLVAWTTIPE